MNMTFALRLAKNGVKLNISASICILSFNLLNYLADLSLFLI